MNADVEKAVEALKWLAGRADVRAIDHIVTLRQHLRDQEAEIARLHESTHYANGVADLAMKHRDAAEQRAEKAEALLQEALRYLDRNQGDACAVADRITAHLGGEHD